MNTQDFSKYLRYALGEIILVVVGILIALRINTWSSQNKLQAEFDGVIEQIHRDMVEDTLALSSILTSLEKTQPYIIKIITDTLSLDEYDECQCMFSNMNYIPFYFKQSGFRALDRFQSSARKDSLITEILSFYNGSIETVSNI